MKELTFIISDETYQMFELMLFFTKKEKIGIFQEMLSDYVNKILNDEQKTSINKTSEEVEEIDLVKLPKNENSPKALRKIPRWATRKSQISHQIIRAFFETEIGGVADREDMQKCFIANTKASAHVFEINLNSLMTEAGNHHGHVFDYKNGKVTINPAIYNQLILYKENFTN